VCLLRLFPCLRSPLFLNGVVHLLLFLCNSLVDLGCDVHFISDWYSSSTHILNILAGYVEAGQVEGLGRQGQTLIPPHAVNEAIVLIISAAVVRVGACGITMALHIRRMTSTRAYASTDRIHWRPLHACLKTLDDWITKFVLVCFAFICALVNVNTLRVAHLDFVRQVSMGISADFATFGTVRNMHGKLCPKTLPVSAREVDGTMVIGMVEKVDEPFACVLLNVCVDHVFLTTHNLRHDTVWLPEEATCS